MTTDSNKNKMSDIQHATFEQTSNYARGFLNFISLFSAGGITILLTIILQSQNETIINIAFNTLWIFCITTILILALWLVSYFSVYYAGSGLAHDDNKSDNETVNSFRYRIWNIAFEVQKEIDIIEDKTKCGPWLLY